MASPAPARQLPVRKIAFGFGDDLELAWNPVLPELACAANGISLLMPYVEPYFVRSVRGAIADLDGPLRDRTEDYLRQELQHHVQHRRFNDLLARQCPSIPRLERWMRRVYGWLGRTRSRRFNVAFAAGSETIAFGIARWIERNLSVLFDDADPVTATLFLWHLAEEVEHKTAAFDVFEEIDGSRRRYAWATTVSLVLLVGFTFAGSLLMLRSLRRLRYPVTWFRLARWSVSLAFTLLPTVAQSALPGHHPSALADPTYLTQLLRGFDPTTATMPLWQAPARRAS